MFLFYIILSDTYVFVEILFSNYMFRILLLQTLFDEHVFFEYCSSWCCRIVFFAHFLFNIILSNSFCLYCIVLVVSKLGSHFCAVFFSNIFLLKIVWQILFFRIIYYRLLFFNSRMLFFYKKYFLSKIYYRVFCKYFSNTVKIVVYAFVEQIMLNIYSFKKFSAEHYFVKFFSVKYYFCQIIFLPDTFV